MKHSEDLVSRVLGDVDLDTFLQYVLDYNQVLQIRVLEYEISRKALKAEKGIFEPRLVSDGEYVDNERKNTSQDRAAQSTSVFLEENHIYNSGLEFLLPTGAQVRFGANVRRLENNLQGRIITPANNGTSEYVSFIGTTITQPLLKNAWFGPTFVNIRLAAVSSEISFQEYRRQMILTVSQAQAAYWEIYLAQEQYRFLKASVEMAVKLHNDIKARQDLGKASPLDVLRAYSGILERESELADFEQNLIRAINQAVSFYSDVNPDVPVLSRIRASESPAISAPQSGFKNRYYHSMESAFEMNPEYLVAQKQIRIENIRVAYAKNQRLPQLDLRASYGLNGLDNSFGDSFDDLNDGDFTSYSFGVQLSIPVLGDIRARSNLQAAELRKIQALRQLKDIEARISTGMDSSIRNVENTRKSFVNYDQVVNYYEKYLNSLLARMEAGDVVSAQAILDAEQEFRRARLTRVAFEVRHVRALIESELIEGSILLNRDLEIDANVLRHRNLALIENGRVTKRDYDRYVESLAEDFKNQVSGTNVLTGSDSKF